MKQQQPASIDELIQKYIFLDSFEESIESSANIAVVQISPLSDLKKMIWSSRPKLLTLVYFLREKIEQGNKFVPGQIFSRNKVGFIAMHYSGKELLYEINRLRRKKSRRKFFEIRHIFLRDQMVFGKQPWECLIIAPGEGKDAIEYAELARALK